MPSKPPDGLLEPDALKGARPVLRGEGSRDALPPTRLASTAYVTFTVPTTVQISRTLTPQTADHAVRAFSGSPTRGTTIRTATACSPPATPSRRS